MKIVETVDEFGRNRKYQIADDDDPEEAAEVGIDVGVPDLKQIDWDSTVVELSNKLYSAGIFTSEDLSAKSNIFMSAVKTVVTKKIIKLYGA